jgi:hypothetical protein
MHVCVCLGPVLASRATSLPAAAVASWRGWGLVHINGWSYDGVGQVLPLWQRCVCLLLQDLVQSCLRGRGGILGDMCYERQQAEACVD